MSEYELWRKILSRCVDQKIHDDPGAAVSSVYNDAYKLFLNEKWVCQLDPNKFNFTEEEYEKIGFEDGPDLTRIPRTRYNYLGTKEKRASKPTKLNRYQIFCQEKSKEGIKDFKEIGKLWKELPEEQKKAYDINNTENK